MVIKVEITELLYDLTGILIYLLIISKKSYLETFSFLYVTLYVGNLKEK